MYNVEAVSTPKLGTGPRREGRRGFIVRAPMVREVSSFEGWRDGG